LIEDYRLSNEQVFKVREIVDQLAEDYGFEYGFISMPNLAYSEMTFDGFDAVYLAGGANWSIEDMDQLIEDIKASRLPSFSAYGVEDVRKGILASNQSEDNKKLLFRRIALNLEQIVEFGEDPGDLPISAEYYSGLTINVDQFNALGIGINYDLISDIDFVGEFKAPDDYMQLSLTDVLDMVLNNNLQIKSDSLAVAISGQEVKNSVANYFPKVDVSSQGKYTDPDLAANSFGLIQEGSLQATLQLSQNIYSQDLTTLIKISKLQKKAQNERYNATTLNAINAIYNAYYFSLALNANLKIQAKNLEVTRENLKIATENYKAGSKGKMDLLRFTSEKAQNTQALIESNNNLRQSYNQIKQILNLSQNEKLDVKDVSIEEINQLNPYYARILEVINTPNLTAKFNAFLIEEGIRNAPELKALSFDIDAAEKQVRLKGRGRFVPNFALVGQYNNNLQTWGEGSDVPNLVPTTYNVAVNVSIPIFDQNKKNIDRTRAVIQKDQLETNQNDLENVIAQNISDALLEIVNQAVNIKLSRISEETASESLSLTQTSYTEGAVTITQLIDAQRNHLSAQLDLASAEYSFFSACNNLEREISYYFVLHDTDENESFFQRFYTYALEN
jgi:outer membrane protein TolC